MENDSRWQQVLDRRAGGEPFVYAVRSTGIYCRPTCPSRRPRRDRVEFHEGAEQARAAGYRACLRCRPDDEVTPAEAAVVAACRAMVDAGGPLTPAELTALTGFDARRLSRAFAQVAGTTARAFGDAVRIGAARALLRERGRVAEAVWDAGFGSVRAFYGTAAPTLGMTPSAYAGGGAGERLAWTSTPTAVGCLLAVAGTRGLCAVRLGPELGPLLAEVRAEFPAARLERADDELGDVVTALAALAAGRAVATTLPVDLRGTAFQARVWEALRAIPAGQVRSYREVAQSMGVPTAVRAVAGACAANRLALLVPCHRVVRSDGTLGGFRWGLAVKQALLDAEQERVRTATARREAG